MINLLFVSLIIQGAYNMMISKVNSAFENINLKQDSGNGNSDLQAKLMAEQRRLKAVDSDTNMNAGDKAKEKLKIQQQIDELNRKMKMEEMEKESADSKEKAVSSEENKTEDVEDAAKKINKTKDLHQDIKKVEDVKESKKTK